MDDSTNLISNVSVGVTNIASDASSPPLILRASEGEREGREEKMRERERERENRELWLVKGRMKSTQTKCFGM